MGHVEGRIAYSEAERSKLTQSNSQLQFELNRLKSQPVIDSNSTRHYIPLHNTHEITRLIIDECN
jgi:hypothetical protein